MLGELGVHEQPIVVGLGVEGPEEVNGESSLCQRQLLHPLGSLGGGLFNDGLHQEAGALDDGVRRLLEQSVKGPAVVGHLLQQDVELFALGSFTEKRNP